MFTFYLDIDLDGKRNAFFEVFRFLIEVLTECTDWDPSLELQKDKKADSVNKFISLNRARKYDDMIWIL